MTFSFQPTGPCPSRVMIVGEFPSVNDERLGLPLAGFSGEELDKMMREAGMFKSTAFTTLAIRTRPPGNDIGSFIALRKADITPQHLFVRDKRALPIVADSLELLKREIEMCQPHVIIALGNIALWALTGKWGIMSWRGSVLQTDLELALPYKPKVIPTYNPSMILRQWSWRQIAVADLRRANKESASREVSHPNYSFVTRPSYEQARGIIDLLLKAAEARGSEPLKLAVDIETRAGHIACVGFAWSEREALCIPLMCVERPAGYWNIDEEVDLMHRLSALLTHRNVQVVGQNFSYDAQYFQRWLRYTPRLARDTMLAQHSCFGTMQKSLDFLSSMYCAHHVYWKDDGKDWDQKLGEDQLWSYNCEDAVRTFEVDTELQKTVSKLKLDEVNAFQQRLFWPVLTTMNRGIRPETRKRGQYAMMLHEEIAARQQWIMDVAGYDLNPASPKQMQDFFYSQLNFKPIKNREGNVTCDEEALQTLKQREPLIRPLINKILELRSLNVFLSTFVNAPLDSDGRIRCSFNIGGTETYRFSSSKNAFGSGLNLQNIPAGGDLGDDGLVLPNVRELFIPDPGFTFFDIDLNSADLRIVMEESDCREGKAILASGEDFYSVVGKEFYRDPSFNKKDPRRNKFFKPFCHGSNYLGSAKGLAERLGISVKEAERTQAWYFGRFPEIRRWHDDVKDQVLKRRMIQNVFGYRRYFFERIEGTIFNEAVAWIPQSTIACLINRAYVNIDENLPMVQILLQVHDSLAGQYPTREPGMLASILEQAKVLLPYPTPMIIPVGVKTSTSSWGECG